MWLINQLITGGHQAVSSTWSATLYYGHTYLQCEDPKIAKLVQITPITIWFMVLITIDTGAFVNQLITGWPHIVGVPHGTPMTTRKAPLHPIPSPSSRGCQTMVSWGGVIWGGASDKFAYKPIYLIYTDIYPLIHPSYCSYKPTLSNFAILGALHCRSMELWCRTAPARSREHRQHRFSASPVFHKVMTGMNVPSPHGPGCLDNCVFNTMWGPQDS